MIERGKHIVLVVLIILLILAALVLAARKGHHGELAAVAIIGGRTFRGGAADVEYQHQPRHLHPMGIAMAKYARKLGPEDIVGVHPLDRDQYDPLYDETHGGASKPSKPPPPKKPWTSYNTWSELMKDKGAMAMYFKQRSEVLGNPNLDWGPVLREMVPKLEENREYIGLVNLMDDGRTLRLDAHEASPIEAGTLESETAFASVPGELVHKYAQQPALYIFHTHPADLRGSPLPSSHDLATAIHFAAVSRFAASVVISRYGVLMYGLEWSGYKTINEAKDWNLALLNLSHDIVASHEAIRSWDSYTLSNYFEFYTRHRLFLTVYPTPEMIGDSRQYRFIWNIESPIDHELITEYKDDITKYKKTMKQGSKVRKPRKPRKPMHTNYVPDIPDTSDIPDIGFD